MFQVCLKHKSKIHCSKVQMLAALYLSLGTVCNDYGLWDMKDVKVACRQLGFSKTVGTWHFGRGSGKVWLNNMQCTGLESSLGSCIHRGWGSVDSRCKSHKYDVGVYVCSYLWKPFNSNIIKRVRFILLRIFFVLFFRFVFLREKCMIQKSKYKHHIDLFQKRLWIHAVAPPTIIILNN